jgi:predicted acetyltransferase
MKDPRCYSCARRCLNEAAQANRTAQYGKLRHRLNERLMLRGGHIGYVIRPSERGNGYASLFLRELVRQAAILGIDEALLTCDEGNMASRRAIERNGGVLIAQEGDCCRYTIRTEGAMRHDS